jgi:hypothetical protein
MSKILLKAEGLIELYQLASTSDVFAKATNDFKEITGHVGTSFKDALLQMRGLGLLFPAA